MKPKRMAAAKGENRFRAFKLIPRIALLLFATVSAQKKNSCIECHSQMEGALSEPVLKSKGDVHDGHGLSCVDCHRGDATTDDMAAAMDRTKGLHREAKTGRLAGVLRKMS